VDDVLDHVRETVGPGVHVAQAGRYTIGPSPAADTSSPEYRLLQRTISQVFPGTLTAPNLLSGGTDTRHYERLTRNIYRLVPVHIKAADLKRFHRTNERVGVADYAGGVRFYAQLLRNAGARF
jgi:carboxypeptidase PM20D1